MKEQDPNSLSTISGIEKRNYNTRIECTGSMLNAWIVKLELVQNRIKIE